MFFIGHFSFDEWGAEEQPRHGYFTCVVSADDADTAARQFRTYIVSLKETAKMFENIAAVYLEDIFEVGDAPAKPVLLRLQSAEGPFPRSVSRSFPLVTPPEMDVYGWAPEVEKDDAAAQTHHREAEPFLSF